MSNLFGRSYNDIGSTSADLLLKTRGLVKIQFGNKFIDLIKDGRVNTNSKLIYESDSVGTKEGIYVVDGSVTLVIGELRIPLTSEGNTYVSFLEEQTVDRESKVRALTNIGFIYNSLEDIKDILNGVVYILSHNKLYTITDGVASEFSILFPNPLTKLLVIEKTDNSIGSIVIRGEGLENGIVFDNMSIWSGYISFLDSLHIQSNSTDIISISNSGISSNIPINAPAFQSSDKSFQLYTGLGGSTLIVDNIISKNLGSSSYELIVPPEQWFYKTNVVKEAYEQETGSNIVISTLYENNFNVGDKLTSFILSDKKLESIQLEVTSIEEENIVVKSNSDLDSPNLLINKALYLVGTSKEDSKYFIPKIDQNGFYILDSSKTAPLIAITKDGIDADKIKVLYLNDIKMEDVEKVKTILLNIDLYLNKKQDKLIQGDNIKIENNLEGNPVISASISVNTSLYALKSDIVNYLEGDNISFTKTSSGTKINSKASGGNADIKGILYSGYIARGFDGTKTSLEKLYQNDTDLKYFPILDIKNNVINLANMFDGCSNLQYIDFSKWDTSNVTRMDNMFNKCTSLKEIDLSGLETDSLVQAFYMFGNCSSLESIKNIPSCLKLTNCHAMFLGCSKLTSIDLSNFSTGSPTQAAYMFSECSSLKNIDTSKMGTISVPAYMFSKCTFLTKVIMGNIDVDSDNTVEMFGNCKNLEEVSFKSFKTESLNNTFLNCEKLGTLDLGTVSGVKTIDTPLKGCSALRNVNFGGWDFNINTGKILVDTPNIISISGTMQHTEYLDISSLPNVDKTSIENIIDGFTDYSSEDPKLEHIYNIHSTAMSKLDQSTKDKAEAKGWTLK